MDAAERNGYTGKDGPAEARRAIRSGLRNGLRHPPALPDFTRRPGPRPAPAIPPGRPRPSAARQGRGRAESGPLARTCCPRTSGGRSRTPTGPPATAAAPR